MLGITILPEYIQSEGAETLLDNLLKRLPLTAVSTSPYVMEECSPKQGGEREPPADSDKGLARLLDRPLWGKREVWVTAAPSFVPNLDLYKGLRYQPQSPTSLTHREGNVIDTFIEAAHKRGIKVFFQVQAAIPPGYRVQFGGPEEDDKPCLPDGSNPQKTLDNNGSLASPHILDYGEAMIRDLLIHYPEIDGIRTDWPEFPPYFFESIFLDFGSYAEAFASQKGFSFETMKREAQAMFDHLTIGLTNDLLTAYIEDPSKLKERWKPCHEWLEFKSAIVSNLLARFKRAILETGGPGKSLFPSAFPPPWNTLSGFDYTKAAEHADAISSKHYTMHWPMMLRNYSDYILERNPSLSPLLLAKFIAQSFDAASPIPSDARDFHYPEPNEAHPVSLESITRKQFLVESMAPDTPIWPIAHSYGPTEDFIQRAGAALSTSKNRLWINRYAYLNEEKLKALETLF